MNSEGYYERRKDFLKEQVRKYRLAHPRKKAKSELKWRLKSMYNLDIDQYKAMIKKRKGRCDICRSVPKCQLCVDHNHNTFKIRGLLCTQCNAALGLLKDSLVLLRRASKYLKSTS